MIPFPHQRGLAGRGVAVEISSVRVLFIADDDKVLASLDNKPADVLVSCGDLPDHVILECAGRCACRQILAVKGNHDSRGEFRFPILDLHLSSFVFEGVRFAGFAGAWRYKPEGNFLFDQAEVSALTDKFPPIDIFVAHNSPRGVHDREDEVHLGFEGFASYIDRAQPALFVHGHQHVAAETRRGRTVVLGVYGSRAVEFPSR